MELQTLGQLLFLDSITGDRIPTSSAELMTYIKNRFVSQRRDITLDVWGTPYRLQKLPRAEALQLKSAGPDHIFGNADDITVRVQLWLL